MSLYLLTYFEISDKSHSRSFKMTPFESLGIQFRIRIPWLCCIISETKRDIGRKSRFFIPVCIRRSH